MKKKKVFLSISFILIVASLLLIIFNPPKLGIEFSGGTSVEFSYNQNILKSEIENRISGSFETYVLREKGGGYSLQVGDLDEDGRLELLSLLNIGGAAPNISAYQSIGPSISSEITRKALIAALLATIIIILYVAFAFRKVSYPVSSWKYGLVAMIALAHDVIIPTGIYSIFSYISDAQIDVLFVTALLAIIGYSINDTIVIFDRIREGLRMSREQGREVSFSETIESSVNKSFSRSINTSLTTAFALGTLYFLGGAVTQWFALTLLIGVFVGTYSSLFFAAPLLSLFKTSSKSYKDYVKDTQGKDALSKAERELNERLDRNHR
ncbi:MAG: protein translocase subunit SecF [Candidatus Campbellbacteria bacterium]|nr:protein translocase subunit SecF [Candidatus Campbellbacteria bacterium]